jgi:hypothetical protein
MTNNILNFKKWSMLEQNSASSIPSTIAEFKKWLTESECNVPKWNIKETGNTWKLQWEDMADYVYDNSNTSYKSIAVEGESTPFKITKIVGEWKTISDTSIDFVWDDDESEKQESTGDIEDDNILDELFPEESLKNLDKGDPWESQEVVDILDYSDAHPEFDVEWTGSLELDELFKTDQDDIGAFTYIWEDNPAINVGIPSFDFKVVVSDTNKWKIIPFDEST